MATLLRSGTSSCSLAELLCQKLDGHSRLGAWEARQWCLQLASIYWSYYHTVCFDKADSHYRADRTLLTIQGPIVCPVSIVFHGLPPALVLRLTAQCWSYFSTLNTAYTSYLHLEVYLFTASKVVILYHALPICRDRCQSAPDGRIYFGGDVEHHLQTAWRSRRARRGDRLH
jgi:hypothetical protein